MTELSSKSSPTTIRVAVLIAMPSPPSSSSHASSSTPPPLLSASITSSSSKSHPLEPSSPTTLVRVPIGGDNNKNDDEESLPHLEMGVADVVVVVGRSAETTWDNTRRGEKGHSRGSSYAEP